MRWWEAAAIMVAAFGALVATVSAVLSLVVARTVVTPPRRRIEEIEVLALDREIGVVTLSSTVDSRLPGEYSLFFSGESGSATVGPILSTSAVSVTRRLLSVSSGDLVVGVRGRFSGWFYRDPADLGVPFRNLFLETELGPAPAWIVPSGDGTSGGDALQYGAKWVIQVHGRAVRRQETLRAVTVFRAAGFTSLLVSYRNDGDAPASRDGRYALGDTEWRDVDVAVRYAIDHGARNIVLMGWSMGGATVLQELTRSAHAASVSGIVLDSPVIDWRDTVRFQSSLRRLPAIVSRGALAIMSTRWVSRLTGQAVPVDFARLDFVARAGELSVPVLILHSDDDGFVPIAASRALAAARPDIVTLEAFSIAAHAKLWNLDPLRWNTAIADWLASTALNDSMTSGHS